MRMNQPNVTSLLDRVVKRSDNVLADPFAAVLLVPSVEVFAEGLTSDGHDVPVDKVQFV